MREFIRYQKNNWLLALFIFQFGFLQPICVLLKTQLPVVLFTFFLLGYSVTNNRFSINKKAVCIIFTVLLIFVFDLLLFYERVDEILNVLTQFLLKCGPAIYIASLKFDNNNLFEPFEKCALLNFGALCVFPLFSWQNQIGYMRYGYAMLPSVIVFYLCVEKYNKMKRFRFLILFGISAIEMILFGNRGTILCFAIFIVLRILYGKLNYKIKGLLIIGIFFVIYIMMETQMVMNIIDYIYNSLNIQTYSLMKLKKMLLEGISSASSGRDVLYKMAIDVFRKKPIIGNGVAFSFYINNGVAVAPHNIVLQLLVEFGMLGLGVFLVFSIYMGYKYFMFRNQTSSDLFVCITMLLAVAFGRLLVSSDLWQRPEFWILITMLICNSGKQRSKRKKV